MEKINIAELLKDCPKGMELNCTVYNDVTFLRIDEVQNRCYFKAGPADTFWTTCEGRINGSPFSKCVIFPKGKTTWEGFVPPYKFNDGDVIFTHTNALKCNLDNNWVSIFKEYRYNRCACYVCLCLSDLELYHDKWEDELLCELCEIEESRFATEEEKQKLFQAIKDNGYRWNAETKTLEKLTEQKFDITTLKPFDKVLVRENDEQMWTTDIFSFYNEKHVYPFMCVGHYTNQCIPYEQNKHLLGTTDDCDEFYKTWG